MAYSKISSQYQFICEAEEDLETIVEENPGVAKPGMLALVPSEDDTGAVCTYILGVDGETWYKLANLAQLG